MIRAKDHDKGVSAKVGDDTQGNVDAKKALDFALMGHLKVAYPGTDWSDFVWRPRSARVGDEGQAGWLGVESTDGDVPVPQAGCEQHWRKQMTAIADMFGEKESRDKWKQLQEAALSSLAEDDFWHHYYEILFFLTAQSEAYAVEKACGFSIFYWGDKTRRERLVHAWRPPSSGKCQIAEIGHSQQQACGRKKISLHECLLHDACHFARQSAEILQKLEGTSKRRARGLNDSQQFALEASRLQQRQTLVENSMSRTLGLQVTGGVHMSEDVATKEGLVPIATHRFDKEMMDSPSDRTRVRYSSSKPNTQRITGILHRVPGEGTPELVLSVSGGCNIQVPEYQVDQADVDNFNAKRAFTARKV